MGGSCLLGIQGGGVSLLEVISREWTGVLSLSHLWVCVRIKIK